MPPTATISQAAIFLPSHTKGCDHMGKDRYFYGQEADQFTFYRIPKALFNCDKYKEMTTDAKLLYGLMLDRMGLSRRNGWADDEGRIYIFYTLEEAMEDMNCSHNKGVSLYQELEKYGLIVRKKQGRGMPAIIYVLDCVDHSRPRRKPKKEVLTSEKGKSRLPDLRLPKKGSQDFRKREVSHYNKTDINDTEDLLTQSNHRSETSAPPSVGQPKTINDYEDELRTNIDYPTLVRYYPTYQDVIDGIIALMADECASTAPTSTISGQAIKREYIRSRLLKLRSDHIRRVLTVITDRAGRDYVTNTRGYLLTMLYRVYSDPLAAHLDYSTDGLPLTPDPH